MPVQFSTDDLRTPESLERVLRQFESALRPPTPTPTMPTLAQLASALLPLIRDQLQAPGGFPLNLTGLLPGGGSGADIETTHALRISNYTPPSIDVGSRLYETDRTVTYIVINTSGALFWHYYAGVMVGATLADRPSDLTTTDAGFIFVDTALVTQWTWTGTAWFTSGGLYQSITNAATAAATRILILQHLGTGAGAAGMGVHLTTQLPDSASNTEDASTIETVWSNAANGSETSVWSVLLRSAGAALATAFQVFANGAIAILGKITSYNGASPVDGKLLIGNTGAGTYDANTLTGTANQIIVTNGAGTITLTTPQNINTTSSPTFVTVTASTSVATPLITTAGDLFLNAGGNVKFGTFAAIGAEVLTGYVTITDAGGTPRKVGIIA